VLLLEDSGALIGLFFATAGVALAIITGNPLFDGLGTLAIGALLVTIAIVLAIEMKSLLIGEAATQETIERIEAELGQTPGVRRVMHVLTQHLGPEELLVAAKLEFETSLTMGELAGAINACEARVRSAVPIAKYIYLEPDLSAREP
jgi:divalent metal cation (Fe/Co/Zn/Cd) transporter